MKQVLLKTGTIKLEEVPSPVVGASNILVRVSYSCLSVGTESTSMASMTEPLYKRALKQPKKVKRAVQMVREQGLISTVNKIRNTLTSGQPTGYSASGIIIAIGCQVDGFKIGDRVTCAGAGVANHAEIINVPVNLAVRVPEGVPLLDASTVTMGAIAMQGVRRAAPTLGEHIVVVGLGLLGQLTVQLLKANGCQVIGIDIDSSRLEIARSCGMDMGINPLTDEQVSQVAWMTGGLFADAVIVTAASTSNDIISLAMRVCRKKGRVVLVGDVGLDLKREDFYRKELDFFISTSYGPGRYDPNYEDQGHDYPLPYVRWTENRNMAAYLQLLADGKVMLTPLGPEVFDLSEAETVYSRLAQETPKPLLAFLRYSENLDHDVTHHLVLNLPIKKPSEKIRVALIGAGNFAQEMHLPNIAKIRNRYEIRWVISRTGSHAKAVALQYNAAFAGTDYQEMLGDPDVDLVLIATRHDTHASIALDALNAGKHVLVEKPLALYDDELAAIELFYSTPGAMKPFLMTGFNRRYSPPISYIKNLVQKRIGPMMISYRMNAGYLPPDHWVHGPSGGGRNIGEACHIYDLFAFLTGSKPVSFNVSSIDAPAGGARPNENFVTTITYSDGSLATLLYTALGCAEHSKERMDIYVNGKVISLDDYRLVSIDGGNCKEWSASMSQKGQFEELIALADTIEKGICDQSVIKEQFVSTRLSFLIEQQLHAS